MPEVGEVTILLRALRDGRRDAFDRLVPLVYDELRRIAHHHLRRSRRGRTLNTTALVHEAWLKMSDPAALDVKDRSHFLAVSACAMRQVLVDFARTRTAAKRGGGQLAQVTLDDGLASVEAQAELMLDLDRALARLRVHNERLAQVVECRYFAGMSEEETAEALGVSLRTAQRDWLRARAWLKEELSAATAEGSGI
jgi:RNA polymerase sigma-70 factor, ECF subfamily